MYNIDYYVQEGIMPEYFAIKGIADNPLWGKYIDWLNNTYFDDLLGCIDEYYGFDSGVSIHAKLKYFKNNPVELTLEQWDKIINKKEEVMDKEIIGWKLKEDCKKYEQAALKIINSSMFYIFDEGYNFVINNENESRLKKAGVLELWFEPVFAEEFKVGDWYYDINNEFDGLRNRCLPILEIINNEIWCKDFYGKSQLNSEDFKRYYRKATPEEIRTAQTLQFGGYDVTFEKVNSGVRITYNGETGTFSQIEAIYNYFKPNSTYFKFGSQEVKSVTYTNGDSWNLDLEHINPIKIKIGCTTGTWEEFVAIYEKAKSML